MKALAATFSRTGFAGVVRSAVTVATWAIAGATLGALAWPKVPALAVLLPLLWVIASGRLGAAAVGASYELATVRFLPDMAGRWFDSQVIGLALWIGIGAISALVFAALWPKHGAGVTRTMASVAALLSITMLTAVVMPGHPIFGWGFLLPGWSWIGVGAMVVATALGAWAMVCWLARRWPGRRWLAPALLGVLAVAVPIAGARPPAERGEGRLAGTVGAISTGWGSYPAEGSMEVVERIMKIGQATQQLAGGDGSLTTVIYPENVLGRYDPSVFPLLKMEVGDRIQGTGQTVVIGADVMTGRGRFQNAAIVLRPDGTSSWIGARQTTPVGQWKPWDREGHMPADWFGPSVVDLGGGVKARLMFCHEEYMPVLHLLSEAREPHHLVVGMANLWAARDGLADAVQGAHTEGIALLMGKKWVRAVNGPRVSPSAK